MGFHSTFSRPRPFEDFYPTESTNVLFTELGLSEIKDRISAEALLRRPEVNFKVLAKLGFDLTETNEDILEQVEIQITYQGYIEKDLQLIEGVRSAEMMNIPSTFNYGIVPGLSNEIKGKLLATRPENIGQASRISGVTPAAVANLMIYLKNKHVSQNDLSK